MLKLRCLLLPNLFLRRGDEEYGWGSRGLFFVVSSYNARYREGESVRVIFPPRPLCAAVRRSVQSAVIRPHLQRRLVVVQRRYITSYRFLPSE